jgi:hypothetical protein
MGEWKYSSILNLDTKWSWVVIFTALPLYNGGRAPGIHGLRIWLGHQTRSRRCGEEKYILPLQAMEPEFRAVMPIDSRVYKYNGYLPSVACLLQWM